MTAARAEKRADAFNTLSNSAAIVPEQTLNEIIPGLHPQGGLFGIVRHFSVPANLAVPVGTPTDPAAWHVEGAAVNAINLRGCKERDIMLSCTRVKKMQGTIEKMVEAIQNTSTEERFIEAHKSQTTDFTRNRNLGFDEIMHFVIGNLGTSLDFEVMNFCNKRTQTVSAAAISKARDKVKYTAFEELLKANAKCVPVANDYKGYRLTAYDGIKGELPRTKELMRLSNTPYEMGYPQFHAIAEYDVLNCCYTDAIFELGTTNERKAAVKLLERHNYEGKEIFLLDRGFPGLALIQQLEKSGKSYVMRVSKSFLKEVNAFGKSYSKDEVVQVNYDKKRGAASNICGVELPSSFSLRCVKIELNEQETEILVTNLNKTTFSRKEIGELYNLRWKVETGFLNLKYAVCIEDFMGIKLNSIKQEFFASLIKSNIYMQFVEAANDIIFNKKNREARI